MGLPPPGGAWGAGLPVNGLQPHDPERVGNYRLLGRLGAGGMGQVFLGTSPGGRQVAVKLVHPEHARSAEFRARFAREVEAAKQVSGFYTATVVDADPGADPPWMVTAYIPGPTLQDQVDAHGPLPLHHVRALGAQLAEGLAAIHACGLVHRDLKPGNVILAGDGPRIIDFGIAVMGQSTKLTATGMVIGTFAYMSPEQARGEQAGPAADVFALGGVLAFAATGLPPFAGSPPDLDGVADGQFRQLVVACLARSAADRPTLFDIIEALSGVRPMPVPVRGPSAAEATGPLSAWPPTRPTDAGPELPDGTGPASPVHRAGPSRRTLLVAGLGTAVAGGAIAGVVSLTGGHSPKPAAHSSRSVTISAGPPILLDDSGGGVYAVAFSPTRSTLASGNVNGTVQLWDIATRARTATLVHTDTDHANPAVTVAGTRSWSVYAVAFSPDGSMLASGNGDGTTVLWDAATGQRIAALPDLDTQEWNSYANSVAFSPDGSMLATSYDAQTVTLWDVVTRKPVTTLASGSDWWVYAVAFSPDGSMVASGSGDNDPNAGSSDGLIQLWGITGTRIATLTITNCGPGSLAFSPDGATLANVNGDGAVTLWKVATRANAAVLTAPSHSAKCVAFSPDGTILASGNRDGTVTLWDVAARRPYVTLQTGTSSPVRSVTFSPDGAILAGGSTNLVMWAIRRSLSPPLAS
jgi:WD40 repeat protein/serine/threonine protein kinase